MSPSPAKKLFGRKVFPQANDLSIIESKNDEQNETLNTSFIKEFDNLDLNKVIEPSKDPQQKDAGLNIVIH